MLKLIENWFSFKQSVEDSEKNDKQSHFWIVRVWTNDTINEHKLITSFPFSTRSKADAVRKSLKESLSKPKVTIDRIDMNGDYIYD